MASIVFYLLYLAFFPVPFAVVTLHFPAEGLINDYLILVYTSIKMPKCVFICFSTLEAVTQKLIHGFISVIEAFNPHRFICRRSIHMAVLISK